MLGILSSVFKTATRLEDGYGEHHKRNHEQRRADELHRRKLAYDRLFYQRHHF